MQSAEKQSSNRVIFLDNLRCLFVLCVVIFHAGNMFSSSTKWWPVTGEPNTLISILNSFLDVFTMPLLFFIAGYFALPTIQKQPVLSFLKGKLKRLGIPWIVCMLTVCPILPLIYHYTRNGFTLSMSYFDTWLVLMKNTLQFDFGMISINEIMINDGFYQRYMWFLSLLILFFIIFSIIYKLRKSWFEKNILIQKVKSTNIQSLKLLLMTGFLILASSGIVIFTLLLIDVKNPMGLLTLGNLVQFAPAQLVVYIYYFALGIIIYRNKWIERGKFPGSITFWIMPFCLFLLIFLYAAYLFAENEKPSDMMFTLYGLSNSFLCISILGLFSSITLKYWNRPTAINRNLASNSYYIYLSHYIFVLVFQLILFAVPGIPVMLKFVIVSAASIACAYLVSQFIIKPFPKITILLLFIMLITMFVFARP